MIRIEDNTIIVEKDDKVHTLDLETFAYNWQTVFLKLDDPEQLAKAINDTPRVLEEWKEFHNLFGELIHDFPALFQAFLNEARKLQIKNLYGKESDSPSDEISVLMAQVLVILDNVDTAPQVYSKLGPWGIRLWVASNALSKKNTDENRKRFMAALDRVEKDENEVVESAQ